MATILRFSITWLVLLLLAACATNHPWPERVVGIRDMRPLGPVLQKLEITYRRSEGRPAGKIVLQLHVDEKGLVQLAAVLESSGHASLDRRMLDIVRDAHFSPYLVNGVPTAVTVIAPLYFSAGKPD